MATGEVLGDEAKAEAENELVTKMNDYEFRKKRRIDSARRAATDYYERYLRSGDTIKFHDVPLDEFASVELIGIIYRLNNMLHYGLATEPAGHSVRNPNNGSMIVGYPKEERDDNRH